MTLPFFSHLFTLITLLASLRQSQLEIEGVEREIVPVQIISLKEKIQNSHQWFFNAFGAFLKSNVCVLLDAGTMPGPTSIYYLWKAFDISSNVGGVVIVASKGKYGQNFLNPLIAAQKILSIRCRTSWINLCTSLFLSWQLTFFRVLIRCHIFQGNRSLDISRFFLEHSVLIVIVAK